MSYTFSDTDAQINDAWFQSHENRYNIELENELMFDLLQPARGETVLGIGCGTGARLFRFLEKGLEVTGIDNSESMLEYAEKNLGNRVDLHQGNAEDLPFDDNSFNISLLINTLEFVDDPLKALEEACRVTKDRVFIGAWNKSAVKDINQYIKGMMTEEAAKNVRFLGIGLLKKIIFSLVGDIPVQWKTVGHFGGGRTWLGEMIDNSKFLKKTPLGTFLGMLAVLVPSFRTTPLELKVERTNEAFAGAA